jgi:CDP-diacylglycerol--glycerol-3-phosphate 3-phosphatidyltransferase
VDRLYVLAPILILLGVMIAAFVVYCFKCWFGRTPDVAAVKHNQVLGRFLARYLVWLIGPIERRLVNKLSPNVITMTSLAMCAVTGFVVAVGELPSAVTLYAIAGILDVLDGRIARLSGKQTKSGALLDSVSDRWGELFVLTGYAWLLRGSFWMVGSLAAVGGSMMVSYTRARAEGLGIQAAGGIMQRAERIVLVALGTLIAACAAPDVDAAGAAGLVAPILGVSLSLCGAASCATAVNRFLIAYRALKQKEPAVAVAEPAAEKPAHASGVIPELRGALP